MIKIIASLFVLLFVLQFVSAEDNETVEEPENQSVEPQTQKPITDVCYPDCRIGDSCVEEGVQKQEGDVLYYCGYDNKAFPVKADGEVCSADYECESYNCKDGYCSSLVAEEPEEKESIWVSVVVVAVIIGAALLLLKFGLKSKEVTKTEKKKMEKKETWAEEVKGVKPSRYTYRPELDVLEKKLKEKLKR